MMRTAWLVTVLVTSLLLGACNTVPFSQGTAEGSFDANLDKLCTIPTGLSGKEQNQYKVVRGKLVLAAIAGYSYRTIDIFSSKTDIDNDVAQSLTHINASFAALTKAKAVQDQDIFPVYRADYIDELARAAAVAAQPAVRVSKTLVTGTNADRVRQATAVLGSVFEDELYVVAYRDACTRFAGDNWVGAEAQADARIQMRCESLAGLLKKEDKSSCKYSP